MKKAIHFITLLLILMLLLVACSIEKTNTNISSVEAITAEPTIKVIENSTIEDKIVVKSPITLSNNNMYPLNGKNHYLRLRMVEGKYYEDWNPGPYMGTIWEGNYSIDLVDESGITIAQTYLSEFFTENLLFMSSFDIQFDDYNNDGDLDFTLGQYATSNGNDYKLFTLRDNGIVEELPIKENSSLFISNPTDYYSTKLTKINNISFSKQYYDNSKGKYFEDVFEWVGKQFVLVKNQELKEKN
jgi:bla regulator protein BlaR1